MIAILETDVQDHILPFQFHNSKAITIKLLKTHFIAELDLI